ncbi:MAG: adenylate/guanylate cyclase domain-containing protein [Betaproteobacteria bacterium HGW-Betaproteobacteria-12]|nr:MAG: adenylate/guanylate cyclase domain-containing protein [Betaproteobacteria bacterium HGW-Betaproteobacteria-12]
MQRPGQSRWLLLLPLLPLGLAALLLVAGGDWQVALRNALFDQYQRWQPRPYVEVPVRIIDIDEASLARLGQWPWPRQRLAALVDRLQAAGSAAIGFDVLFAEADRTAPQAIADLWQLDGALRRQVLALPDHDRLLAASLQRADVVLGFALTRGPQVAIGGRMPTARAAFVHLGEPQLAWLHAFAGAVPALPLLEGAARGNGALSFVPDADGVVRRVPLVLTLNDQPLPGLAAEALRVAQGGPPMILRSAGHGQGFTGAADNAGLGEVRIGDFLIPSSPQGELWVHYTGHRPQRSIAAWRILAGEVSGDQLAGQILLVGSSAQGLMDLRFGPFGVLPGVEVHAQALEQMLSGQFLQRPAWARGGELAFLVGGGLLVGLLAVRARALIAAAAGAGLLALGGGGAWYAFRAHGLLLDAALPALAIVLTFIVCSLAHHLASEREQRWIKEAFARYVSPNRVAHLVDHPEDMNLGGERRDCSFIFTDLTSFTGMMEGMDPGQAVALLNDYLDRMIAIAFAHDGTLDRIVGDAVAIMFSAPVAQPDHRQRALACGLAMDAFACTYAAELQARGIPFGQTRIGIHAGEVIVGNFGGNNIFDYRALGDPVNTASRLEAVNKYLGTRLCISEEIHAAAPETPARPVGQLVLKGKSRPLAVFEPLAAALPGSAPLADYLVAYDRMRRGDAAAGGCFAALHAAWPDDPLVALHSRRLQAGDCGELIVMAEK